MTTLTDAPPLVAPPPGSAPPPITVTRGGRRWPQDSGGRMANAWDAAWQALASGEWCDAMALAASAADAAGVEVHAVRHLLSTAAKEGILAVRHRVRGEPRRLRADYRIRPKMADSYEAQAADLVRRYLAAHGRREGFHPRKDLDCFQEWLRNVGQHKVWRRCRDGSGQDVDGDLFAVIGKKHPRLVDRIPTALTRVGVASKASAQSASGAGEGEPVLVVDPARPTAGELAGIRVRALSLTAAVARQDWSAVWELHPRSAADGGYLASVLSELLVELARDAGHPLGAFIEQARSAALRAQNGGLS